MVEYKFDRGYFEGAGYGYAGLYHDFTVHYRTVDIIMKRQPTSVIDIGGARGYIAKKLIDRNIPAYCMDISKYCYYTRATDNFYLWDMTEIPYLIEDKKFDLAVSISVLEHIPENKVKDVIKEIARISSRSLHGISFTSEPNDIDKTHITIHPKEWWEEQFRLYAPDHQYEILDKEETEQGDIIYPPSDGLLKLNVSSFINMFHYGWINIDIIPWLETFAKQKGYVFRLQDIRNGFIFARDNTVDLIVTSHFLEHLNRDEGRVFLKECFRVLKPKGTIRIVVPDLEKLTREYNSGTIMRHGCYNVGVEKSRDSSEALFTLVFNGHQTAYDEDSLCKMLIDIGFGRVIRSQFNNSTSPVIRNQTTDFYPELSLYVEAIR